MTPPLPPGSAIVDDPGEAALLARLAPAERAEWDRLAAPKRRAEWLLGRAAAKAAVRALLASEGRPAPDEAGIIIEMSAAGAPLVRPLDAGPAIAVSLTHGHGKGAGLARRTGAGGGLPGLDLERVRPRRRGTFRFYLDEAERAWVASHAGPDEDPPQDGPPSARDRASIALWALKEAAFKALQPPRGTGLLGVRAALLGPLEAQGGLAEVRYVGDFDGRARDLGVVAVQAAWREVAPDLLLAWVLLDGARLP